MNERVVLEDEWQDADLHAVFAMLEVGNASDEREDDLATVEESRRDLPAKALTADYSMSSCDHGTSTNPHVIGLLCAPWLDALVGL